MNLKLKDLLSIAFLLAMFLPLLCYSQNKKANKAINKVSLKSEMDTISYSLGMQLGKNIKGQGVEEINIAALAKAISDVYSGNSRLVDAATGQKIWNNYKKKIAMTKFEETIKVGKDFMEQNKTKEGVITLSSGMQYIVLTEGTGATPVATDKVTTHYHGTTIDGNVFDSSVDRGQPASFPVSGVIPGWVEALQLMKVGAKWRLFIPPNLAYGERGAGPKIGPYSTLIFEVELISIN
ncbi:FKBP-type peptidyl-prolyl cis-trans isomerase [Sphingobacteriaceae bacterium AH-315-L07]|nr:FKBP-type peptidyl-prolyl cis-trans isomerase [Sphingobacteriaceae bacterium AH-315-L07]